jgi:hypothetical protein
MEDEKPIPSVQSDALGQILSTLESLQLEQRRLFSAVDAINGRLNTISGIQGIKQLASNTEESEAKEPAVVAAPTSEDHPQQVDAIPVHHDLVAQPASPARRSSITSRIILTTYRELIPSCLMITAYTEKPTKQV